MITAMDSHASAYELRYSWTRRSVLGLFLYLLPTAVAIGLQLPLWSVALIAIFGGGIGFVVTVVVASSRRPAVRVDANGLTLSRVPVSAGSRTQVIPWGDIEAIRVWQLFVGDRPRAWYISADRRAGAPELVGHPDLLRSPQRAALVPPASKQLAWCDLDRERLRAAVTAFAPDVRLVINN